MNYRVWPNDLDCGSSQSNEGYIDLKTSFS